MAVKKADIFTIIGYCVTAAPEESDGGMHYLLRWLTPTVEVDLCGHATLAAAHALYESGRVPQDQQIVFHTCKAGRLTVRKQQGSDSLPPLPPFPTERVWCVLCDSHPLV